MQIWPRSHQIATSRQLFRLVQESFDEAYKRMKSEQESGRAQLTSTSSPNGIITEKKTGLSVDVHEYLLHGRCLHPRPIKPSFYDRQSRPRQKKERLSRGRRY